MAAGTYGITEGIEKMGEFSIFQFHVRPWISLWYICIQILPVAYFLHIPVQV